MAHFNNCMCELPADGEVRQCERHGVVKPVVWVRFCQTRQDYWEQWEAGVGPGQQLAPGGASTTSKKPRKPCTKPCGGVAVLWNFAKSVSAFVADGCKTVDKTTYRDRLVICDACDKHRNKWGQCDLCKCFVRIKTKGRVEECPEGRWGKQ